LKIYNLKKIIYKYDIKFCKSLGQNFLFDENILKKIVKVSEVDKNTNVIEIGTGFGTLTKHIAKVCKKVVTIEIDKKLILISEKILEDFKNIKIICEDVLKLNIKKIVEEEFKGEPFCVVANIPYSITTPIIIKFLSSKLNIVSLTILMQKEVAQRLVADVGRKEYGSITVFTRYYSNSKILFSVSPNCFIPKPTVKSALIKIKLLSKPSVIVNNEELFFSVVRASFKHRRKTLLNSLAIEFNIIKEKLLDVFLKVGLDENVRGERLTVIEFGMLTNKLELMYI
jgi:16S rRNA (adenine1518-N6/adenine1519-N6)-dimethyltransferase